MSFVLNAVATVKFRPFELILLCSMILYFAAYIAQKYVSARLFTETTSKK